ncbi:MAG: erythronate-4-phosphate dehydrogenase, partial [Duncaniella sp.]|nr:erythronate-4-phosphate dehydrogenase [Duncaniella sp.]
MKIVVDRNIPFIEKPLSTLGRVVMLPGSEIMPETMADTDILVTRTRTRCDASLLDGSQCRFIGTATIGTDHIDIPYCATRGITVANAPGCNAPAV